VSSARVVPLFALWCALAAWGLHVLTGSRRSELQGSATLADRLIHAQGCYRLELHPLLDSPFAGFTPAVFRLSTERRLAPLAGMQVEPRNPRLTYGVGPPFWELLDRDSLRVQWGTGLGGVTLTFQQHSDSLVGTARGWTDVGSQSISTALGVHIPCPSALIEWEDTR